MNARRLARARTPIAREITVKRTKVPGLARLGATLALAIGLSEGCTGKTDDDGGANATHAASATYVLVHGAWMGAWAWDGVAPGLRAAGANVVVVELPAHGADMTPLSGATFASYVAAVSSAIDSTSGPVTLVGHSLAGMVITQVAENMPDRVAKLVYLAAYLPQDGQALFDLAKTDTDSHLLANADFDVTTGLASIPTADLQDDFLADGTAAEVAELQAHYRSEPLAPLVTPVHTTAANWGHVPKVYLYTEQDHAVSYALQQRMTAGVRLSATRMFDTSHSPFLSNPAEVVSTLSSL
jgi:pimeloyl-ACP methyl ester carboxylesterase